MKFNENYRAELAKITADEALRRRTLAAMQAASAPRIPSLLRQSAASAAVCVLAIGVTLGGIGIVTRPDTPETTAPEITTAQIETTVPVETTMPPEPVPEPVPAPLLTSYGAWEDADAQFLPAAVDLGTWRVDYASLIDGRLRIIVSTDYFSNDMHAWRQIELPDIRLTADGVSMPLRLANQEATYRRLDDSEFTFGGYKYAEYTLDERVDLAAFTLESGDARAEIALAAQHPRTFTYEGGGYTTRAMLLSEGSRLCYVETDFPEKYICNIHVISSDGRKLMPGTHYRNYEDPFQHIRRLEAADVPYDTLHFVGPIANQ